MASTRNKNNTSSSNASLCACGSMRQRMTAGPQASFPGREFFKCESLERESSNDSKLPGEPKFEMPQEYKTAMNALSKEQMETGFNEVMLLHGTDPDKLYSILFEGLDPAAAAKGNFGRGVYFAESAAKIDQYATEDRKFARENEANDLYKFHKEIYKQLMHPHNVYYCLISRVLLGGRIAFTKDGRTHMNDPGKFLFLDDERRRLAPMDESDGVTKIPSALIGEPGERGVETYREYVIFEPERILVKYLVAYKRVRSLCDCGLPVIQRTVVANTVNRGQTMITLLPQIKGRGMQVYTTISAL